MGRHEEALADFTRAIDLDPGNAGPSPSRCGIPAMGRMTRPRRLHPRHRARPRLPAIANRGQTYRLMGRHDEALADFTRAIDLDPATPGPSAAAARPTGDGAATTRPSPTTPAPSTSTPRNAWAIAGRGETYRLMGRHDEALADFTRAIDLDPRNAWAIASRARPTG